MGRVVVIPIGKAYRLILRDGSGPVALVHFLQEWSRHIRLIRSGAEDGNIRLGPEIGVADMSSIAPQCQDPRLVFRICRQGHAVHTGIAVDGVGTADVDALQVHIIRQGNLQAAIFGRIAARRTGADVGVPRDGQGISVVQLHRRPSVPGHIDGLVPIGDHFIQLSARDRIGGGGTDGPVCQIGQFDRGGRSTAP